MGSRVWFTVQVLGARVQVLGFGIREIRISDLGRGIWGLGSKVEVRSIPPTVTALFIWSA